MTPEEQLNKILEHLSGLHDTTLELNNSIEELSSIHSDMQTSDTDIHNDVVNQITDMHSSISTHMTHTEQMVANLLHPDRIDHLTNFMKVMDQAMNPNIEEE